MPDSRPLYTRAILFAPHNDDETLFAFFQLLRYKPKVIVVLRSFKEAAMGGPDFVTREAETDCAMRVAGCEWVQFPHSDLDPDWALIAAQMNLLTALASVVIAPAFEDEGHEHHNMVATLTAQSRPDYIPYLTYKRGRGRSEDGTEVIPTEAEAALKRRALDCYQSQISYPDTAPWFAAEFKGVRVEQEFIR